MLAEDRVFSPSIDPKSPEDKMAASDGNEQNPDGPNTLVQTPESCTGSKHIKQGSNAVGALALVPIRKQSGIGFLRRLLLRKRRGSGRKSISLHKT